MRVSWSLSWPKSRIEKLGVRQRHEDLLRKKPRKTITLKAFRDATANLGRQWTVIRGSVYDVSMIKYHPGGDFLHEFVGIDSTLYFYSTHIKSANVWARLRPCWQGYLIEPDVNDRLASIGDRKIMQLVDELAEQGYFQYPMRDVFAQLGVVLSLFAFQIYTAHLSFVFDEETGDMIWEQINVPLFLLGIVAGTMGCMMGGFLLHDAGHQAIFSTKRRNQLFTRWCGIILMGVSAPESLSTHDYHHSFPNVLHRDGTLETGPFKWHSDQLVDGKLAPGYSIWAPTIWYSCILWLYAIIEIKTAYDASAASGQYWIITAILTRLYLIVKVPIWCGYTWHLGASHLFCWVFSGYIVALTSTFNHLAEEKENIETFVEETRVKRRSFVRHQAGKTSNLNKVAIETGLVGMKTNDTSIPTYQWVRLFFHRLVCWTQGHFNYHIEHHMMPYLPRQFLPLFTHRIREICELEQSTSKEGQEVDEDPIYTSRTYVSSLGCVIDIVGDPIRDKLAPTKNNAKKNVSSTTKTRQGTSNIPPQRD